jgi:hypothetical protein
MSGNGACGLPWYRTMKMPPATSKASKQLSNADIERLNQKTTFSNSFFTVAACHNAHNRRSLIIFPVALTKHIHKADYSTLFNQKAPLERFTPQP